MTRFVITHDSMITKNHDLVAGLVDSDVMLMDMETGKYYQMNRIGGEILEILDEPMSLGSLLEVLQSRFRVSRETLEAELPLFLQQLASRHVVSIE